MYRILVFPGTLVLLFIKYVAEERARNTPAALFPPHSFRSPYLCVTYTAGRPKVLVEKFKTKKKTRKKRPS